MYSYPDTLLLLFAREPVRGQVKTRLQPVLGESRTLQLHEELIRHTAGMVSDSGLCPWRFCVAGDPHHALFGRLSAGGLPALAQQGGDLGARMSHAVREGLSQYRQVILLGADCASVDADYLQEALAQLSAGRDVVIGPADDGGYVLLGLGSADWPLFNDMPWGSDRVLDETLHRLSGTTADWCLLEMRWDVDRPEDLQRLSRLPHWSGKDPAVRRGHASR